MHGRVTVRYCSHMMVRYCRYCSVISAISHRRPLTRSAFDNDECHMMAFWPISEAADIWSYDKSVYLPTVRMQWDQYNVTYYATVESWNKVHSYCLTLLLFQRYSIWARTFGENCSMLFTGHMSPNQQWQIAEGNSKRWLQPENYIMNLC